MNRRCGIGPHGLVALLPNAQRRHGHGRNPRYITRAKSRLNFV